MSQSGYTPIQLYRTTTASATPSAGNLSAGELAINLTDEKLFFKNAGGTVKTLATSGTAAIGGSDTQVQYNSSGVLAGSSSFVFDGTNVGIGTSSPKTRLQVSAAANLNAPVLGSATNSPFYVTNTDPAYGLNIGTNTSDGHVWLQAQRTDGTATAYNITLNEAGGNVGIGTSSPSAKLDVVGTSRYTFNVANSYTLLTSLNAAGSAFADAYTNALSHIWQTSGSERMRIDSSGNVGIGTTTLNGGLTVNNPVNTKPVIYFTSNTSGAYPTAQATTGSIDNNFSGGAGEVSFWNNQTTATTAFVFRQQTGASSRTDVLSIGSTGSVTSPNLADAVGYKGLPQNAQTGAYTLALADAGKHVSNTTGGFVIPANGSVAFPVGTAIVLFNNSGSTQTISITTDTLRQAGTTNTGTRTLAAYGLATCVKVASTTWVVSGNVS